MPEPLSLIRITALSASPAGVEQDSALPVGVGDRVVQHMLDRFAQAARISEHEARPPREISVSSFCAFSAALARAVSAADSAQASDVDAFDFQRHSARVAGGEVEDVVDQLRQALDGLEDRADVIATLWN